MNRHASHLRLSGATLLAVVLAACSAEKNPVAESIAAVPRADSRGAEPTQPDATPPSALEFTVKDITGEDVLLARKYRGKVVLIVNVASRCGFTKQYGGLQALHEKYAEKGLAILGFPCNQFGGQEPGTNQQIQDFCRVNFGVNFDLFDKIEVNGDAASPLYKYLTGDAVPFADKGPVRWNFEKFLVGRDGQLIARYRSKVTPEEIVKDIETALATEERSGRATP